MSTIRLTTAQALVRFLNNQYLSVDGVEHRFIQGIFAIFGHGNVLGLGQALEQEGGDLVVYQGRNEQGMAHAAIGFARQKLRREIIACTSSVGPGAANMITAAATATANRIPLLLLPGDVFATRQPDPVLQQIEQSHDLSLSTNDAFRAVSKYWDRINRPEQLMSACINALRVLTDPAETGAVTLCLPQDVQGEAWDFPDYFFCKRVHLLDRRLPGEEQLEAALSLLCRKKKPLIICGGGVKYAGAGQALRQFAERFQLPFAETQAGKGTLTSDHPLNLGGIGETGCLAANLLAKEADLIIGIGTRYTDFTTSSKWLFQHPQVDYLTINISRFDAYKLDAVQLVADARAAIGALESRLIDSEFHSHWGDSIQQAQKKQYAETQRVYDATYRDDGYVPEIDDALDRQAVFTEFHRLTDSFLTQTSVLGVLNEQLPADAVIVGASGSLPGDLQRIWRTRGDNSYHVEYGYSCMGYEVNAALGVKLAEPHREVYSLVGDGAFMMLHSELVTSLQENAKVNVILFDNMTNGCINNLQIGHGMDSFNTEFRFRNPHTDALNGDLIPVDYAAIAAGYGCKTWRVTTLRQLEQALTEARHSCVSTLIDIKVLPKTMAHNYLSWWHVGGAQVARSERITAVARTLNQHIEKARKY
ncbi:3D-(3,5/4)-trihydroxycyclohexane-1,2-dione acylhydrolase (decyclizing) [Erwinia sp. OLTSP20]|uniref:3D-(3,5/4)-trihydroxycyclohexane-1,2-dione acylhydrolase (decyclizing) n=1 Tax=unclassified Erwinia TaxID=2622719 RepID=UPI000C1A7EEF|nr:MULTISPECIES: 3D-(3,5/4)-trihydroxycyclohexane-1,2-dione acylhydrolase (decyclizing) [unclassified Erwinia]PIJ51140.1 3D-(3,5/4)-trihydroxycyclohexane-1,2-dione acylhydrolase (decyclizing) [Erwinia sp. OAMSP11]PIJ73892.1 3D-(3,5/4)-trihydroxycyclohexane-1,2-dione acylhydrolase (decyclizing) [Erwinia sp. OLSSP12]PIJ83900.1 3D-(3,5/4)-trihydroxycyclohexane-1,2-dione acylhydrolase (decyclizing) [Erwinia sp. OLCASP19]PIJ86430.1 3D-(3,5/4)-trihydroxycyclohexane-1,2-dione acylhydrolase (decyclizin